MRLSSVSCIPLISIAAVASCAPASKPGVARPHVEAGYRALRDDKPLEASQAFTRAQTALLDDPDESLIEPIDRASPRSIDVFSRRRSMRRSGSPVRHLPDQGPGHGGGERSRRTSCGHRRSATPLTRRRVGHAIDARRSAAECARHGRGGRGGERGAMWRRGPASLQHTKAVPS